MNNDRLYEMCLLVPLTGKSYRTAAMVGVGNEQVRRDSSAPERKTNDN